MAPLRAVPMFGAGPRTRVEVADKSCEVRERTPRGAARGRLHTRCSWGRLGHCGAEQGPHGCPALTAGASESSRRRIAGGRGATRQTAGGDRLLPLLLSGLFSDHFVLASSRLAVARRFGLFATDVRVADSLFKIDALASRVEPPDSNVVEPAVVTSLKGSSTLQSLSNDCSAKSSSAAGR